MKKRGSFLSLCLDLLNEGRQPLRLWHASRRRDQQFGIKTFGQVGVEDGPHSSREFQASHEVFVQATTADHIERFIANLHLPYRGEAQGHTVGKILLPEKGVPGRRSQR